MSETGSGERRAVARHVPPMPNAVRLLEELPPHRLPEELVAAAELAAGCRVALYVGDIGGACLRVVSGSARFPDALAIPQALGPELPRGRMGDVQAAVSAALDDAVAVPLWVQGRAVAVLVAEREPDDSLEPLARQAAAAVELADRYTDVFARRRRHRPTTAAAEVQENLLPPRFAAVEGAEIAGGLVPAYEVGGDWFDHAQNDDGVWLAVADAVGKGSRAAGASTVALGALRAARRAGHGLAQAGRAMNAALVELDDAGTFVTAVLAHWAPAERRLSWLRFGHPLPLLVDADGEVRSLPDVGYVPLGLLPENEELAPTDLVLSAGDRFVLTSDGVWERRHLDGTFVDAGELRDALAAAPAGAAATATALVSAVLSASPEPPHDDATVLVLSATGR